MQRVHRGARSRTTSSSIEAFLEDLELFHGLGARAIRRIALGAVPLDAARDTVILRRGEACIALYIVLCGRVKLSLPRASKPGKVLEVIGPGHLFGEMALFRNEPSVLEAQCIADSRLLLVARGTVLAEIGSNPRFGLNLVRHLSARLRDVILDVEAYSLFSGTERVLGYLLRALPAQCAQGAQRVVLDTQKSIIASQLNLTHEHFSRILHELAKADLIHINGRDVLIPNVDSLRLRARAKSLATPVRVTAWTRRRLRIHAIWPD